MPASLPYLAYKIRRADRHLNPILRPRDLLAPPRPPREPTAPAERFTAVLLNNDLLDLPTLRLDGRIHNIVIRVRVEEIRVRYILYDMLISVLANYIQGAVEGCFQDNSTFKLHLHLHPEMFMTPMSVVVAEFTGNTCEYRAPTWLKRLRHAKDRTAQRVRSYAWLWKWVLDTLTTPGLELPAVDEWSDVLKYVARIKVSKLVDSVSARCAKTDGRVGGL